MGHHRHPGRGGLNTHRLAALAAVVVTSCSSAATVATTTSPGVTSAPFTTVAATTSSLPVETAPVETIPVETAPVETTVVTTAIPSNPTLVESRPPFPGTAPLLVADDLTPAERAVVDLLVAQAAQRLPSESSAFALARNGTPIAAWSAGRTARGDALTRSSRFRVASISKLIVTLAVLRLAEDDRIALDEPVLAQWTPPATPADPAFARVTVRQLLQHTSGLDKHRALFFDEGATDWHDAIRQIVALPLVSPPGREFRYTNADFAILGEMIEQLIGLPFDEAVGQLVLEPLGITSAVMVTTSEQPDGDPWYATGTGRNYMETTGPAGAWAMTPLDALALVREFDASTSTGYLLPASIAAARTGSGPIDDEPDWQYGLGLMIFRGPVGHTGTLENALSADVTLPNDYSLMLSTTSEQPGDGEGLLDENAAALDALLRLPDLVP